MFEFVIFFQATELSPTLTILASKQLLKMCIRRVLSKLGIFWSFACLYFQLRWYQVLGNHDWEGNTTAQVAYTKNSSRWYLPSAW